MFHLHDRSSVIMCIIGICLMHKPRRIFQNLRSPSYSADMTPCSLMLTIPIMADLCPLSIYVGVFVFYIPHHQRVIK